MQLNNCATALCKATLNVSEHTGKHSRPTLASFGALSVMSLQREIEADDDWTERFIQTIESKPALYCKMPKEHSDRNIITRLWTEVCETMIESWNDLTLQEKTMKGKEIQQRWRNIRTCFRRELNKQIGKSGQLTSKRRKYVYFDHLLFLLPTIEYKDTVSEISPSRMEGEVSDYEDEPHQTTFNQLHHTPAEKPKNKHTYEELLLGVLKDKKTEDIDEDKLFLLSLVPSFKKMTDEQKIETKMEFLSIIKQITQSKSAYSSA